MAFQSSGLLQLPSNPWVSQNFQEREELDRRPPRYRVADLFDEWGKYSVWQRRNQSCRNQVRSLRTASQIGRSAGAHFGQLWRFSTVIVMPFASITIVAGLVFPDVPARKVKTPLTRRLSKPSAKPAWPPRPCTGPFDLPW